MADPTLTPRALVNSIIEHVAREHDIEPTLIWRGRLPKAVAARIVVAHRLRDLGLNHIRIANMMHITYTTARTYLGKSAGAVAQ